MRGGLVLVNILSTRGRRDKRGEDEKIGRKVRSLKPTEKSIENSILKYLNFLPNCFAWKNNSVGIFDPIRKVYRKPKSPYLINGVSDIVGIYNGKPLFLEVKRTKAPSSVSPDQIKFLKRTKELGAISGVVTSVDDVKLLLSEYKEDAFR